MACNREILILISAFADGETAPDETIRAREHLEGCIECRQWLEERQVHLRMLQWANTCEQPSALEIESLIQTANWRTHMGVSKRETGTIRNRININLKWLACDWNWGRINAVAGSIVVILSIAFLINHFIFSSDLKVGEQIIAEKPDQVIKLSHNISFEMGPMAKVTRIDNQSVRLEQGWITASVVHGTGFRVVTRRMEVLDQGTKFQVGTGSKADYVIVDEGSISVKKDHITRNVSANQALLVDDKHTSAFALWPADEDLDDRKNVSQEQAFVPDEKYRLDREDGMKLLGAPRGLTAGGDMIDLLHGKLKYRCSVQIALDLRRELRAHYHDIIKALSGTEISNPWDIPVGFLQVYGISEPKKLSSDLYYIHLVSDGSKVEWRLTDLAGNQSTFPLQFKETLPKQLPEDRDTNYFQEPGNWMYLGFSQITQGRELALGIQTKRYPGVLDAIIQISDWPGEDKPVLKLGISGIPVAEYYKDASIMLSDVIRQTAWLREENFNQPTLGHCSLLYLDPMRRHQILIALNHNAGKKLVQLQHLKQQGRGGSVLMYALSTDVPLVQPSMPKGVYLIWYVLPNSSQLPHWEITTTDLRNRIILSKPQNAVRKGQHGYNGRSGLSGPPEWTPEEASPFGIRNVNFTCMGTDDTGFPFRAMLEGWPGNEDIERSQGWIWVSKP